MPRPRPLEEAPSAKELRRDLKSAKNRIQQVKAAIQREGLNASYEAALTTARGRRDRIKRELRGIPLVALKLDPQSPKGAAEDDLVQLTPFEGVTKNTEFEGEKTKWGPYLTRLGEKIESKYPDAEARVIIDDRRRRALFVDPKTKALLRRARP